ncbi:nardilysin-like isoform X2 [Eutrema salsugineum]|uniref:nardilysin-like isoform X2 n=1 Tax=Eutrema salsugineum TaxID=72664 RepID=UPI000CED13C7|nr:nardilysin-like isoform X2 [Eutrema salsugineum]
MTIYRKFIERKLHPWRNKKLYRPRKRRRRRINEDIVLPPADEDIVLPPADEDIVLAPVVLAPASADIVLPPTTKEYRHIRLENGMEAILVSDPMATKAAASLSVRVGSYLDPVEFQGMAHFLEHMLFLGSKKFPGENQIFNFLAENGGSANASTVNMSTQYYLTVHPDSLREALDMFSQMFISPLLESKSVEKELDAVNAEFELNKDHDSWRLSQLMAHTARDGHPIHGFMIGSKTSLGKNMTDLRMETVKFFNKFYLGGLMKFSVTGKANLDVLESWVKLFFSDIKEGTTCVVPEFDASLPIWNPRSLYVLEAREYFQFLDVTWMIPSRFHSRSRRLEVYLVQLLGHVSKGSLSAFLKKQGLAFSVEATSGVFGDSVIGTDISVRVDLTRSGFEKKYEIVTYIYQYLKLLRDTPPEEWVIEEYQTTLRSQFDLFDSSDTAPEELVNSLSENMLHYEIRNVLSGHYGMNMEWKPEEIQEVMEQLTPINMRIDLKSRSFSLSTGCRIEPIYNSLYTEEEIPQEFLNQWENIQHVDDALHMPSKNRYTLSPPFLLRDVTFEGEDVSLIVDTPFMKMWHKHKKVLPVAKFCIFTKPMESGGDSFDRDLKSRLFVDLLEDELSEIIFLAKSAGMKIDLTSVSDNRLELGFHGSIQKLGLCVSQVWEKFFDFQPTVDRLEIIKEKMGENADEQQMERLSGYSLNDLQNYIRHKRSQIYLEGLYFGDILISEAKSISNFFKTPGIPSLPENLRDKEEEKKQFVAKPAQKVFYKNKINNIAKVSYHVGCQSDEVKDMAMLNLLISFIEDRVYYTLRTEERLGYSVCCVPNLTYAGVGFDIKVTSPAYSPDHLWKRIRNFVKRLGNWLVCLFNRNYSSCLLFNIIRDHLLSFTWSYT